MGAAGYALSTNMDRWKQISLLGRFRKRKRPRGRRMRGLILNTAGRRSAVSVIGFWEEE